MSRGEIQFSGAYKEYVARPQRPFVLQRLFRIRSTVDSPRNRAMALQNVTFQVGRGEAVGVIGPNGSGKSTLLGLVAGTTRPSRGSVVVEGTVGPLLELGVGFHPDLTGRENAFLNMALLGASYRETKRRIAPIMEFAGLGIQFDGLVRTYSTGMLARLGFAVTVHMKPDILLVDEALSVGDLSFQRKCEHAISEMRACGTTLLLVSHDLQLIERACPRILWLGSGVLRRDGTAPEVLAEYRASLGA